MNNILNLNDKYNQLFIASVIAVLCEQGPITLSMGDIKKYWDGEVRRLQYFMNVDEMADGAITLSLKDENE